MACAQQRVVVALSFFQRPAPRNAVTYSTSSSISLHSPRSRDHADPNLLPKQPACYLRLSPQNPLLTSTPTFLHLQPHHALAVRSCTHHQPAHENSPSPPHNGSKAGLSISNVSLALRRALCASLREFLCTCAGSLGRPSSRRDASPFCQFFDFVIFVIASSERRTERWLGSTDAASAASAAAELASSTSGSRSFRVITPTHWLRVSVTHRWASPRERNTLCSRGNGLVCSTESGESSMTGRKSTSLSRSHSARTTSHCRCSIGTERAWTRARTKSTRLGPRSAPSLCVSFFASPCVSPLRLDGACVASVASDELEPSAPEEWRMVPAASKNAPSARPDSARSKDAVCGAGDG
eukprot:2569205-Pleurochrysis_carterae.AAC.3